ncbi:MAG: hypothetical protein HYY25_11355 [Candidatus Wallbacteria bacterium]|nr:hypothetical protein [Candidatus Wallbacteria bacterium]
MRRLLVVAALAVAGWPVGPALAGEAVRLLPPKGGPICAAVTHTGATVHVVAGVNGAALSKLYLLESTDDGKSWGKPAELAGEPGHIGGVWLGSTAVGLVVAWHSTLLEEHGVWARVRQPGQARWTDRRALASCERPPAMSVSQDGTVRAVLPPGEEQPGEGFRYTEHDPISGRGLVSSSGPRGVATGALALEPRLIDAGPVTIWLAAIKEPSRPRRVFWSRSARPELGRWSEAESVDSTQRGGSHLDAAGLDRALTVTCESRDGLEILSHPGGKAGFGVPTFVPELPPLCLTPCLTTRDGALLLAFIRVDRGEARLAAYSSRNGSTWKAVGLRGPPVRSSRRMCVAATARALVAILFGPQEGVVCVQGRFEDAPGAE